MSGPIVRRYGFPNFEKIFGERALQHGAEENPAPASEGQASPPDEPAQPADKGTAPTAKKDRK